MELVFATHNPHKHKEATLLMPHFRLLYLNEIGCVEAIPETGATLVENAFLKATYVYEKYKIPCFSDDTGLEVEALNGAPGVRSARYAGEPENTEANIRKLLQDLGNTTNRKACFKTVLALISKTKQHFFEGVVEGVITWEKRGTGGFGYDPLFVPDGYTKTFAELPLAVKNQLSHRAKALRQLVRFLKNTPANEIFG